MGARAGYRKNPPTFSMRAMASLVALVPSRSPQSEGGNSVLSCTDRLRLRLVFKSISDVGALNIRRTCEVPKQRPGASFRRVVVISFSLDDWSLDSGRKLTVQSVGYSSRARSRECCR